MCLVSRRWHSHAEGEWIDADRPSIPDKRQRETLHKTGGRHDRQSALRKAPKLVTDPENGILASQRLQDVSTVVPSPLQGAKQLQALEQPQSPLQAAVSSQKWQLAPAADRQPQPHTDAASLLHQKIPGRSQMRIDHSSRADQDLTPALICEGSKGADEQPSAEHSPLMQGLFSSMQQPSAGKDRQIHELASPTTADLARENRSLKLACSELQTKVKDRYKELHSLQARSGSLQQLLDKHLGPADASFMDHGQAAGKPRCGCAHLPIVLHLA